MSEILRMALRNVMHAKKRSWLTMIGIFIGIAAVVALISLGQGLEESIDEMFEKMGTDKVFIQPGGIFTASAGGGNVPNPLTSNDLDVVRNVPGVVEASGFLIRSGKILVGEDVGFYFVAGVDIDDQREYELFKEIMTIDLVDGRWLRSGETGAATVGFDYTREAVFAEPVGVGERITVNDRKMTVVGIHEPLGSPPDDRTVVISKDTAEKILFVDITHTKTSGVVGLCCNECKEILFEKKEVIFKKFGLNVYPYEPKRDNFMNKKLKP